MHCIPVHRNGSQNHGGCAGSSIPVQYAILVCVHIDKIFPLICIKYKVKGHMVTDLGSFKTKFSKP